LSSALNVISTNIISIYIVIYNVFVIVVFRVIAILIAAISQRVHFKKAVGVKILGQVTMEHPQFTLEVVQAQKRDTESGKTRR